MHFPIVYEYKPDIQGINLENEIRDEPRKLNPQDKKIEIIIPKYAPFFTKSLELTKRDGSPLKIGTDYRIHRIMGGLSERAGQGVGSTIEILNKSLSEVLISYKTLGHFALIDNSVLQTIIDVAEDDRIIHWDDLHGKPVVFPPKLHSHGINDEITGLADVLDLVKDFSSIMERRLSDRTQSDKVKNYLELLKHYIKVNTDMVKELVARHEATKNSHGLTKQQIGLSNVENNPTGNISNISRGDEGYKVKPGDLDSYIKAKLPKQENFLKNGVLPINQYGRGSYIPPSVSGSFEGLGADISNLAIYVEQSGELVGLLTRFDGRKRGGYYFVYNQRTDKWEMTFHEYKHPFLDSVNRHIYEIGHSYGKDTLLFTTRMNNSNSTVTRTTVVSTKNTLDPSYHTMSEISLTKSYKATDMGLGRVGKYCYLTCYEFTGNNRADYAASVIIYRFLFDDIGVVQRIVPERLTTLNYTNSDGEVFENEDQLRLFKRTLEDGRVTEAYFDFTDPLVATSAINNPASATFIAPHPDNPNMAVFKFFICFRVTVTGWGSNIMGLDITYQMLNDSNKLSILTESGKKPVLDSPNLNTMTVDATGGIYNICFTDRYPYQSHGSANSIRKGRYQFNITDEVVESIEETRGPTSSKISIINPVGLVPPMDLCVFGNGEVVFRAESDVSGGKTFFIMESVGKLAIRPETTIGGIGTVYSKPLSSNYKELIIPSGLRPVSITYPQSQLGVDNLAKTDLGYYAFCYKGDMKGYGLTMFDTFKKEDKGGKVEIVPIQKCFYRAGLFEVLIGMTEFPEDCERGYVVTVFDPSHGYSQQVGSWLPIICSIQYYSDGSVKNSIERASFFTLTTTSTINGDLRTINSITPTLLNHFTRSSPNSMRVALSTTSGFRIPGVAAILDLVNKKVKINFKGESWGNYGGVGGVIMREFEFDTETKQMTRLISTTRQGSGGAAIMCRAYDPINPDNNVGVIRALPITGGCSIIIGNSVIASTYPQEGWIVYFTSDETVVLNGAEYKLEPGSFDIRDVGGEYRNKSFYIYIRLEGSRPKYVITEDKLMESSYLIWVGQIKTGLTQIEVIETANAFSVSGHKVSQHKRGNAIPATTGSINEEGQLPWLTKAELGLLF